MGLYGNKNLTGKETFFDSNDIIVSKTDLSGKITYGNRTFLKMAGLTEKQCLGKQHNIIRHPEMPRCVFKLLWDVIKDGEEVFAYVNNRSSNGDNYWVFAHVTPSLNSKGEVIAYHSNRRVPNRDVLNEHIIPLYAELLKIEQASSSPRDGLNASYNKIQDILKQKNMGFNQWMFSLGT